MELTGCLNSRELLMARVSAYNIPVSYSHLYFHLAGRRYRSRTIHKTCWYSCLDKNRRLSHHGPLRGSWKRLQVLRLLMYQRRIENKIDKRTWFLWWRGWLVVHKILTVETGTMGIFQTCDCRFLVSLVSTDGSVHSNTFWKRPQLSFYQKRIKSQGSKLQVHTVLEAQHFSLSLHLNA